MMDTKKFCLIGKPLGHSYSPLIHQQFGYEYTTIELERNELQSFVALRKWDGFNVTIPYKTDIIQYLEALDVSASAAQSVNTVVRRGSGYVGYNTDVEGLRYLIHKTNLSLQNKKLLVLGSGGTSKTVARLAQISGVRECVVVSRSGTNNYENLHLHYDADIIINATPVGMYPNNGDKLIDIAPFKTLEGVIDVIYNPKMTDILFQAADRKLKYANGLRMLVAQAKLACDLFLNQTSDDALVETVYANTALKNTNIVFIGMPSSGKSYIGRSLAERTGRTFIDTDWESEKLMGISIPEAFSKYGESYFRKAERAVISDIGKCAGIVIATGGGAPFNDDCYRLLKQNGIMVHIIRSRDKADFTGRPLLQNEDAYEKLYQERFPRYKSIADIEIVNDADSVSTCIELEKMIHEHISNQRS